MSSLFCCPFRFGHLQFSIPCRPAGGDPRGQPDGAMDQCEPLRVRVPRPYVVQLQVVQTDATVGYIALRQ